MNRARLLGFEIDEYDFDGAVDYAKSKRGQVVTINPEMIDYASKHNDFAAIINNAELVIPDGIGVQIGLKILGYDIKRIAGIEFAHRMLGEVNTAALVGAKPYIIEKTVENIKKEFPNLNIVYVQDGYFKDDDRVLAELENAKPEMILAALGSPKQEEFLYKLKSKLPNTIMIGVGGSFDVWSGEVKRAPEIFQKLGLEWLYRTVKEPKRLKRIFPTLPVFVWRVIRSKNADR